MWRTANAVRTLLPRPRNPVVTYCVYPFGFMTSISCTQCHVKQSKKNGMKTISFSVRIYSCAKILACVIIEIKLIAHSKLFLFPCLRMLEIFELMTHKSVNNEQTQVNKISQRRLRTKMHMMNRWSLLACLRNPKFIHPCSSYGIKTKTNVMNLPRCGRTTLTSTLIRAHQRA